jgi:hypothetical protein
MFLLVALLRTDVSKRLIASIITETRIGELGNLAVTSNRSTMREKLLLTANVVSSMSILVNLMMEAIFSSETSVLIRTKGRNIP